MITQHFVTFMSPGTFVSETTTKPIDAWSPALATLMAKDIVERHGARPFGFQFNTRGREDHELDSRVLTSSGIYYLGGTLLALEDVIARNDPNDRILILNMQNNKIELVVENTNSYRSVHPFTEADTLLNDDGTVAVAAGAAHRALREKIANRRLRHEILKALLRRRQRSAKIPGNEVSFPEHPSCIGST